MLGICLTAPYGTIDSKEVFVLAFLGILQLEIESISLRSISGAMLTRVYVIIAG